MATQRQPIPSVAPVAIRKAKLQDVEVCGRICYEAFQTIATSHAFPADFPSMDISKGLLSMMFTHPGFYCVVAEAAGNIVGSNCLDERSAVAGVGPITVDPNVQNQGTGKMLMEAVLTRAAERRFAGIRLLQSAYHNRSLSLYAKLGFDVREPISAMQGPPIKAVPAGYRVRRAEKADIDACARLCREVHGHDRSGELTDAIEPGTAIVAERRNTIVAYATALGFFGHAVAENNADLEALIANADAFLGPGILVPTRNSQLFRWCLEHGLRVVQPMTLMTIGLYNEPAGAYLPSVLY